MNIQPEVENMVMTPGISAVDHSLDYWLKQVNLRLRREMLWCWLQRSGSPDPGNGTLPPVVDAASEVFNAAYYDARKQEYFELSPDAQSITAQIKQPPPLYSVSSEQGTWAWLASELELDSAAQFMLALAFSQRIDAALSAVISHCMNDLSRPYVTAALAQRLWDSPLDIMRVMSPDHRLFRYGFLKMSSAALDWQQPLLVSQVFVDIMLANNRYSLPYGISVLDKRESMPHHDVKRYLKLRRLPELNEIQVVPLVGRHDTDYRSWAAAISDMNRREVVIIKEKSNFSIDVICEISLLAWYKGFDVLMPFGITDSQLLKELNPFLSVSEIPVRWYCPVTDPAMLQISYADKVLPPVVLPLLSYEQRVMLLRSCIAGESDQLTSAIHECARRFRYQEKSWNNVISAAVKIKNLTADELVNLCRLECDGDLSSLAQRVEPRFKSDELILPSIQRKQYQEVLQAMNSLTRVHHQWGTARAWGGCGLSVLFCGPPGTGKTMAAEVAASTLNMDMYRIDLSQVVNKYIGETEKNLRNIFDAAERTDCILFFDECDALFGKRTEVKDAHDRFANIEVSYLLERMERFKGLAILATNRRKDIDGAFMRRLRYVIEFPLPGVNERELLWRQSFPEKVDVSEIDFGFLANNFSLTGGYIRSVVFNSCLQAAGNDESNPPDSDLVGKVTMQDVLLQVKRELQKTDRAAGDEQFGRYAGEIRKLIV